MTQKDLYTILELVRGASEAEIKKSYRRLAQQYHPDVNKDKPEAEQRFKEISFAYEVLSDPKKRAQYDQFGATGGAGGGGGFGGFDPSSFGEGGGFADIFETFFGGAAPTGQRGPRAQAPAPGADIESVLTLTFEEAAFGSEKQLEVTKADTCVTCQGKGMEAGSKLVTCEECQGTGQVRTVRQTILGQIQTARPCSTCGGEGRFPEKRCAKCHGQKRTRQKSLVTVKIPAGIENGATIRLKDKGEAGVNGGQYGDLYLHIQVRSHARFERRGYDVHSTQTIHLLQAVLGAELSVETIHGAVTLKIPAGTQSGQMFKVKGKGIPHMRGAGQGDHLVKVEVETPTKMSRREKELYMELMKEAGLDSSAGEGSRFKFKL